MNILEMLSQVLAGGTGGNMLASPSMMGPNGADRQGAIAPGASPGQAVLAQLQQTLGNRPELSGAPRREEVPTMGGGTTGGLPTGHSRQGSGIGDFLRNLLGGGVDAEYQRAVRDTAQWLQGEGMDAGTAGIYARDPELLRKYATDRWTSHQQAGQPDWDVETIYDGQGNEQKVRLDKNTGQYVPLGGSKSSILSPAEEAQKVRLAQAGRTQINNNVGTGEGQYDKTVGEGYGKRFMETQQMAANARKGLNTIQVMRQAMNQPGFYSGPASGVVQYGKRLAASFGFDPEGVKDMETFAAMSKQSALDLMGGSLGTGFSNADRDFVVGQVANLGNTPEGNSALLNIQEKVLQRTQEIGKMATDYAKKNGGRIDAGFDDFLSQWSEQNPLFDRQQQQPWYRRDDQGPTRIRNPEQPQQRWRARNPETGQAIEWNGNAWVVAQ